MSGRAALDPSYVTRVAATLLAMLVIAAPALANPCKARLGQLGAEAAEIGSAHRLAEMSNDKPEACRLANLYLANIRRTTEALETMPVSCRPSTAGVQRQHLERDRIVWLSRVKRHCEPGSPAAKSGTQHKIIRVP